MASVVLWLAGLFPSLAGAQTAASPWGFAGADIHNSHAMITASSPTQVTSATASHLALAWSYETAGDVTVTPTVDATGVYAPDAAGYLYRINPVTGQLVWRIYLPKLTGTAASHSQSSPAIAGSALFVGDHATATLMSLNKTTGALNWKTLLDTDVDTIVTGAPTVYQGMVYVGLSSHNEFSPPRPFTSRGSVVAVNAATGAIAWKTYMVPPGYTGGAVWGSGPAVDENRRLLYVATGNNYSVPAAAESCIAKAGNSTAGQDACFDPNNWVDSVLALDLAHGGAIRWGRRMSGADTFSGDCTSPPSGCPQPPGYDNDFSQSPVLSRIVNFAGHVTDDRGDVASEEAIAIAQKTGVFWLLNPDSGGIFWSTRLGPGASTWSVAADYRHHMTFFASNVNGTNASYVTAGTRSPAVTTTAGSVEGLEPYRGRIIWQVPCQGRDLVSGVAAHCSGAVSTVNDVVFVGSSSGIVEAHEVFAGTLVWSFATGASIVSAPAVFNDTVYWGVGRTSKNYVSGKRIDAFAIP